MRFHAVILCFLALPVSCHRSPGLDDIPAAVEAEPEPVVLVLPDPAVTEGYDLTDLNAYILKQCITVGVSYRFAAALLREENPDFFKAADGSAAAGVFRARHRNRDDSYDLGLWQLNENYLWSDFVPHYWHGIAAFDWENPYHNTYIAIRHIKWLYTVIQDNWIRKGMPQFPNSLYWETALAYNAGIARVLNMNIPDVSLDYASRVMERL